jgi:ankyrin repeat protein
VTLSSRKRAAADISEAGFGEIDMDDGFYLDSLTFPQAQFRLEEISTAHKKTCQWIVGQPQYLNWMSEEALASHGGFFWIKGKPGAGKSTMMKYLLLRAKETLHGTVILSFFFHAQGIILERSVMGMYRSLLHQLLCSNEISSDARKPFLNLAKGLKPQVGSISWTKRDVKNLLSLTIKSLQGHHILILIDAVDECNQDEVKDMTTFFQELGKSAVSSRVNLRICLASRHYPHIKLEKGIELIIEDQQEHQADLERYVRTELKGGQSEAVQKIRGKICERASGVFLWVVIVVRALNEAFDRGKISGLQKRLDEIPDGLDDLFTDILTRDQKDKDALIFSLQLILFCRRSLGREEVYFAVLFETTGSIEMDVDWDLHSTTAMDRLILHVTKGLAESSKAGSTKAKPYRVRFIHESVRDFLLQRNGFSRIQSEKTDPVNFIGESHNRLKQVCFSYVSLFCHGSLGQKIAKMRELPRRSGTDETIQMTFPFLDYAIRNVLEHSNLAQAGGVSQEEFLQAYSRGLSDFKCIYNAVERFATRQHKDDLSLLYILVSSDLHDLIPLEMLGESHSWDLCGQYLCPMGAAFRKGSMASVRALLGMQIDRESCNLNPQIEPELIARMNQFFAELGQQTRKSRSKVKNTQPLLNFAFEGGRVDILRLFLYTNVIDFNDYLNKRKGTPLYWSIYTSKPDLVEFLVSEVKVNVEAEMRRADSKNRPLLRAAFKKFGENTTYGTGWEVADRRILDILLRQESLDPKCQDEDGKNAVHWATLAGDEFSVNRLISHGFDYEHCDSTGRDPLSYAAGIGYVDIVKALLEMEKIEVNRRDLSGRTPASWAVDVDWDEERTAMIEALFNNERVDFNAKDEKLRSPLAWLASDGGAPVAIEFLLSLDTVDVNSRDLYRRTPLILAVMKNNVHQVKSLLRHDHVDIDAQDVDGRTALSWAIGPLNFPCSIKSSISAPVSHIRHDDDIVKILLESRTPNTELTDIWGHTPAWWAQAYDIVLAELGDKSGLPRRKISSLRLLGAALVPSDSETIKAEIQRFLEGEYIMKNPCVWDLIFRDVKFGANWMLDGTVIRAYNISKLY